nr:EpsG family protein [Moraxella osloensis]
MLNYILVFLIVCFLGTVADLIKNKILKSVVLFFLVISFLPLYYLRDYSIGTDTLTYIYIFETIFDTKNPFDYAIDYSIEVGFVYLVYLISIFTTNYFTIFTVFTFLIYFNFVYSFLKYNLNYALYIASFFNIFSVYFYTYNILRQVVALSFVFIAVRYLIEERNKKYIFFSVLAVLFHYSSIVVFLYYFLYRYRDSLISRWYIVLPFFIFIPFLAFKYLLPMFDKYQVYAIADNVSNGTGILLKLFYILILVLAIFFRNKITKHLKEYNFFTSMYLVYVSLLVFFELLGVFNQGLVRMSLYFQYSAIFILLIILINIKDVRIRYIANLILFIFLFFYTIYQLSNYGYEVVPYRGR